MSRWRLLTGTSTGSQTVPPRVVEVRATRRRASRSCGSPRSCRSAGRCRGRARTASRSSGRRPCASRRSRRCAPRVAGVLGELARRGRLDDLAAHPAREADALALDVGAGVAEAGASASGSPRNSRPTSSRIVSALCSMSDEALLVEDLERGERPGQERHVLDVGVEAGGLAGGAAAGAVAGSASSVIGPPSPARGDAAARVGAAGRPVAAARPSRRVGRSRQRRRPGRQVRERRRPVRERHRLDEVLLEARLDRGLDLLDRPDDALDLASAPRPTAAR